MPSNNPDEYRRRVKSMSAPMLKNEHNRLVRRLAFDGASCIMSAGSAFFTKGPKAFPLVIAAGSAYKGFDHFDEYEIVCDELAERGVEVRRRTRDITAPATFVVVADIALLGVKSLAKSTGFY